MRESNKLAVVYTRDFGLIYVAVQSVRESTSKLKSHLQTYSLVELDIVQGREIWRLTGIHERYSSLKYVHTKWYPFMEKIASTIQRLCPGEEVNSGVWNDIEQLFEILVKNPDVNEVLLEVVFLTRLLNNLGYWSGNEIIISSESMVSSDVLEYVSVHKRSLITRINRGLQKSQL